MLTTQASHSNFLCVMSSSLLADNLGLVLAGAGLVGTLGVFYFLTDSGPAGKIPFGPGSHVIITGGSSGIGLATAVKFRKRRCNVTIIARNRDKLAEACAAISQEAEGCDGELNVVSADVASKDGIDEAVKAACVKYHNRVGMLPLSLTYS